MKYTCRNIYGIAGESNHRTPQAAIKAARSHEGNGWIVEDETGLNYWEAGNEIYTY